MKGSERLCIFYTVLRSSFGSYALYVINVFHVLVIRFVWTWSYILGYAIWPYWWQRLHPRLSVSILRPPSIRCCSCQCNSASEMNPHLTSFFWKNIQNFDSIRKQFSSKSKNGKQVPNVCFNNRLDVHLCKQMCIVYFVSWWNLIPIYILYDCCRTVYRLLSLNLLFII